MRKRILPVIAIAFIIAAFLSVIFIMGCSTSDDDNGGSTTATLTGTVTNSTTGEVISNATISIDDTSTTTTTEGIYTLTNLSTGTYTLTVSKSGYQSYQASITLVEGTNTKNVTLTSEVTQTGTLTGAVTYGDTPQADVSVTLQGVGTDTTGEDGVYTFIQAAYGIYTVTAAKTGYNTYSASVTIDADSNTHNISLTISQDLPVPEEGKGHVTGIVTDDSGNPLTNVKCTLYNQAAKTEAERYIIVYTDANGEYVFLNVEEGNYQLMFFLSGYNIPFIILDVVPDSIVDIPDTPGTPVDPGTPAPSNPTVLEGIVTRQNELSRKPGLKVTELSPSPSPSPSLTPIEGVTVVLTNEGKNGGGLAVQTDANGKYKFINPPTGTMTLIATKLGYTQYNSQVTIEGSKTNTHNFSMSAAD